MTVHEGGCRGPRGDAGNGDRGVPVLAEDTPDPVICGECAGLFGRGADAGTLCPFCGGPLYPLPAARAVLNPAVGRIAPDGWTTGGAA